MTWVLTFFLLWCRIRWSWPCPRPLSTPMCLGPLGIVASWLTMLIAGWFQGMVCGIGSGLLPTPFVPARMTSWTNTITSERKQNGKTLPLNSGELFELFLWSSAVIPGGWKILLFWMRIWHWWDATNIVLEDRVNRNLWMALEKFRRNFISLVRFRSVTFPGDPIV